MLNKLKNLFGHSDAKQRAEKDAMDEALAGLEGVIARANKATPTKNFAQEIIDESAAHSELLIRELEEEEKAREFLDGVAKRMGMNTAQEFLDKFDELAAEARTPNAAITGVASREGLAITAAAAKQQRTDLKVSDLTPEQRASIPDVLAELDDEDNSADDADEDDTVGITASRLRQLQAIERAANQLLNHVEYRVNHVFSGESKSYYVRFNDLEALKEAFK